MTTVRDSDDVFDLLHAAPIDKRANIASWIGECAPLIPPRRHGRNQGSAMGGTFGQQREADDEDSRATRSRAQDAARTLLSLRSAEAKSTQDGDPRRLREEASVAWGFDATYPPTTVSSMTSLSPTRTTTTREHLAFLSPCIEFKTMEEAHHLGIALPESVEALWERCEARCNPSPPASPPIPLTPVDTELVNNTLMDAFDMAEKWRSTNITESHWISVVVGPILHLLRRLSQFQKTNGTRNGKITVFDITSVEISPPELCPYSSEPDLFDDLDKRIDYAVGLDIGRHAVLTLQAAPTVTKSINQTASFTNYYPMFLNVEVKRNHMNKDPAIQLAAWVAAEFRKRQLEGWPLSMPVLAVEIQTDAWFLHVVTAEGVPKRPDEFNIFFLGPLRLGDTCSMDDTKRLFENLCDIALWGHTEYRLWFEEEILSRYHE